MAGRDDRRLRAAWGIVGLLGGKVIDEWLRRLDLAVDLVGVDLREEPVPAFRERRYRTTAKHWQLYGGDVEAGFSFGKLPRLRVSAYDKRAEVETRSPLGSGF